MRVIFLILVAFSTSYAIFAQSISSHVEVIKVFSQNENYYLHTIPHDNLEPSLKGKTSVYKVGEKEPLYTLDRGFDSSRNELILSNNGEIIVSIHSFFAYEDIEGLKSISIYKNGNLVKSFTKDQITKCDEETERCEIAYRDYDIIDREKSEWKSGKYKQVFRDGATEQEIFLYNYEIFNHNDTLYITDSKKKTHLFDLKEGVYSGFESFEKIYPKLKTIARNNKFESKSYEAPYNYEFPDLQNGLATEQALAKYLGMTTSELDEEKYKIYRFQIFGTIHQDGSLKIDKIDSVHGSYHEKIKEFFESNKFETKSLPEVFEKFHMDGNFFECRKIDKSLARQEKKAEEIETEKEIKRRMTAEKINDIYIPKDLGEAFVELDKLLKEVDKNEMKSLPNRDDMINYHFGLGMWMRNNWGLWGGSRLQKYFFERGVTHPDDMSSIILEFYHDWLNGNKESWKAWDKNALNKTKQK